MRRQLLDLFGMRKILSLLLLALGCGLMIGCQTDETPRAQVDDLKITAQVKEKLAADVGLSTVPDVAVNSTNGIVTLSGQVDTADRKAKVESVAAAVPNVKRVVDNLQVAAKP